MYERIPRELKIKGLWCCYREKLPFDVMRGGYAKSNDRNTFYDYATILNYAGNYDGIGLGIFNGYSAIDIDHCVSDDGIISNFAQDIIDYCKSYTEISPSGTGIRIIFKTNFTGFDKIKYYTHNSKIGLEIYIEGCTNKYVRMSGNAVNELGVELVDIQPLLDKYMKKEIKTYNPVGNNTYNILEFLNKDQKLNALWNSVASGSGGNESETDLALCNKLAFYLQRDPHAIRQAFESSPYFSTKDDKHIKKWMTVYSDNTIMTAINSCIQVYTPKQATTYDYNDTGNAHRFIDTYGDNLRYNVDNRMWMLWNGVNWQFDIFNNVKNMAEDLIEEMRSELWLLDDNDKKNALKNINHLCNTSGKENMLKESQHLTLVPVNNDIFDKNDWLLNCQNGVVDLKSGDLIGHNRNLMLNKISYANYSKDAKCPRFFAFLSDMFMGDNDIIDYLQKAFGYSLSGSCREQCMFILQGDGNDGKSLLLQIIQEVIGDYSATSNPDILLDKKTQSANLSEVARLKGIRYCIVNELKMNDKLNESGVKDITSGNNKIVARFLYGNEFEFLPKMKIWLATNYEPKIVGTDKGIWRRMVKIPCKRSLRDDEVDKDLIFKLREEKDGILNWLVEGCLRWQQEGLKMPSVLQNELKAYRTEMDIIQRWIDQYCDVGFVYSDSSNNLFQAFKNYCYQFNEFPMSQTLFGRNLSKKFEKHVANGQTVYRGVRLRNNI